MSSAINNFESYIYKCRYSNKEGITSYFYIECTIEPTYETMDILLGISRLISNKYYQGQQVQGEMKVVSKSKIDKNRNESIYILEYANNTVSNYVAMEKLLNECRILQNEKGCPFITEDEIIELFKKFNIHERKIS